jgi:hypothetical protein
MTDSQGRKGYGFENDHEMFCHRLDSNQFKRPSFVVIKLHFSRTALLTFYSATSRSRSSPIPAVYRFARPMVPFYGFSRPLLGTYVLGFRGTGVRHSPRPRSRPVSRDLTASAAASFGFSSRNSKSRNLYSALPRQSLGSGSSAKRAEYDGMGDFWHSQVSEDYSAL